MPDRPLIEVACGVLVKASGEVLIAQRPPGKLAAGKWEFPGGKIEPGETARDALARELHEELGITVRSAEPLLRFRHDYSDRCVVLDTWRVTAWDGEPESREGQRFAWLQPASLVELDNLPTVMPILRAIRLPQQYVFTPPDASEDFLLSGIARLPRGALLRLRQPRLNEDAYARMAQALLPACRSAGILLMLDRAPHLCVELSAAGWHASNAVLTTLASRPLPHDFCLSASVHEEAAVIAAQLLDFDCAVLGPVHATPTHPDAVGIGWSRFTEICTVASLPVYAIGGVGPADIAEARQYGAQGVAGISAYWSMSSSG